MSASFLFTSMNFRVTSSKESWDWEKVTAASWYLGESRYDGGLG